MTLDRKSLVAVLAVAAVALSQWPVVDEPPIQLAIFGCGAVLVAVLGVSERARNSRVVVGSLGVLLLAQGVVAFDSRTSLGGIAAALLYWTVGATVVLYQSGFAPWGHPDAH